MKPRETLEKFDKFLAARKLSFEAVVIGGAALALLNVISRQTRDCDVIHPDIPQDIIGAANEFAALMRESGVPLQDDWFNNTPSPLGALLPHGWLERVQSVFKGKAISINTLARSDLLKTKLFAYCDRGTDLGDCMALAPTVEELHEALPWLKLQDAHPDWPQHVLEALKELAGRLGYEF